MDDCVHQDACHEREKRIEQQFGQHRNAIETINNSIAELSVLVTRMAALQETYGKTQTEHEDRIRALELRPGSKWDKLVGSIIAALGGGVAGYIISQIGG